jgi:transposase
VKSSFFYNVLGLKYKVMNSHNYVGVDISKEAFDVAVHQADGYHYYKFPNDSIGFKALLELLSPEHQVVMEASGPYYLKLACYLHGRGVIVSVINPLVIRRFCQMRLSRAKTDKKDARMIAEYGLAEHPNQWKPEEKYVLELKQMQASMDLLNKCRTGILRQQEAFQANEHICKEAVRAISKAKEAAEKQIAILEEKMQKLIEQYHGEMYRQLQSIPGMGKKTALWLIVISGGFTKFENSKQLSSYIGLCPRIFESGTSIKGKSRITKMGMGRIRAMLYMCAWSAKRWNKACKELYDRLVSKGKAKRQALIAVANKLLKQALAIATGDIKYQEDYIKNTCF